MIWVFDNMPALPVPEGLRDVDGEPVDLATVEFVTLWHPVDFVTAWQKRLARLDIVQPIEQAARDIVTVGRFFAQCDEIGWLDQTRTRALTSLEGERRMTREEMMRRLQADVNPWPQRVKEAGRHECRRGSLRAGRAHKQDPSHTA